MKKRQNSKTEGIMIVSLFFLLIFLSGCNEANSSNPNKEISSVGEQVNGDTILTELVTVLDQPHYDLNFSRLELNGHNRGITFTDNSGNTLVGDNLLIGITYKKKSTSTIIRLKWMRQFELGGI